MISPPVSELMVDEIAESEVITDDASEVMPENVLLPENDCVPVEITPREVSDASGTLMV